MRKRKSLAIVEPSWGDIATRVDAVTVMRLRLFFRALVNILRFPFIIIGWVLSILWRAIK